MDPISAIVAGFAAGAIEAARPTAVQAVKDAYAGFKSLIVRKFSKASAPVRAVEEQPANDSPQNALKRELAEAGADRDGEILAALQNLIATLQQHAPESVKQFTNTAGRDVNALSGTFQGPVSITGGSTSIQSGSGPVVLAPVNTGGGPFIGRDQIINNITLQSVAQIEGLAALLKDSIAQLGANLEPDALDALAVVLDEISKLYQFIDTELTSYLSLSFDDPAHLAEDRTVLLRLDGGLIQARGSEARGHCEKISRIYRDRLRPWFQARLTVADMQRVERAFREMALGDTGMSYVIYELAHWLPDKASKTLNLLGSGDLAGARQVVKDARLDCRAMRQKLASTISLMRDTQAELLSLTP